MSETGAGQPATRYIHSLRLVTRLLNTHRPETLHAQNRAQSNLVFLSLVHPHWHGTPSTNLDTQQAMADRSQNDSGAFKGSALSGSGVSTLWDVNQHCREREKKASRDIPSRSVTVTLICPCRLSIVVSNIGRSMHHAKRTHWQ
jgi:hypothetical protein